jgi:hypothetical protein
MAALGLQFSKGYSEEITYSIVAHSRNLGFFPALSDGQSRVGVPALAVIDTCCGRGPVLPRHWTGRK